MLFKELRRRAAPLAGSPKYIREARLSMYRKQEKKLAILCFIVAAIMLYGAVKGYLRYMHHFG
ncbi:hypothetical protein HMPREF9412_4654 [Paenibacillus sp. HGF5]|nr:hypothetical protein HMPREF9412_4654 [Paenibacillus sp. HGF5]